MVLFGSTARGEATPHADIHLLVVADGLPAGRLARHELLRLADEQLDPRLEALRRVGVLTDICPVLKTPDEASRFTPLFLDMVEGAVILHDRGGFFADVLARLSHALSHLGARRLVRGRVTRWPRVISLRPRRSSRRRSGRTSAGPGTSRSGGPRRCWNWRSRPPCGPSVSRSLISTRSA